jgi:hypothetical protein
MRRIGIILAGAALALALVVPAVAAEAHSRGGHRGERHGHSDGRYRHGHGSYHRGGSCYGCDGPGSRCYRYGCDYAYPGYYGGYYGGGYGCNFDYPCGPPYEYNCSKYTGPDGKPPADSGCKYDQKCDCYYHSSQPPPEAGAQPGPEAGAQPTPDQGAQPAPDQGEQPPPDQGAQPAPGEGGEQPRPY